MDEHKDLNEEIKIHKCWHYAGTNYNGCLMQTSRDDYHTMVKFEDNQNNFLENLRNIICGPKHCIGIGKESNEIFIWGETYISSDQNLDEASQFQPINAEAQEVGFHKEKLIFDPYKCILSFSISQVSIGFDHTLFLCEENNKIYVQGMGKQGELGLGTISKVGTITQIPLEFENKIKFIKAGVMRSYAVTDDSTLFAWDCEQNIDSILSSGSNKKHQLGYQDKNISNELKDRYDLLDLLEEQKYKLIDLQVCWNSTIFYCMRDNQPVILICGDHKHGKVDFESDLQLDGALSCFYSKQM